MLKKKIFKIKNSSWIGKKREGTGQTTAQLERQAGECRESPPAGADPGAESTTGTSVRAEKPELQWTDCWRFSVDNSES